ncbi:hypothetical protein SEA_FRANSOYER_63 [Microbacterium phage Fransoyer]|nr:hypothetical protein SEA_FRANSOYER_63 [Microbacterium phage Fransoyer]
MSLSPSAPRNAKARDEVLKLGLWLAIIEGWASLASAAGRLHMQVEQVQSRADWLEVHGYVEVSEALPRSYRWRGDSEFEALWALLVPERPCPVRLRSKARSPLDAVM